MIFKFLPQWFTSLLFRSFEAKDVFIEQVKELRSKFPDKPIAFAVHNGGVIEFLALQSFLHESFGDTFELNQSTRIPSIWIESPTLFLKRFAALFGIISKPPSRVRMCSLASHSNEAIMLSFEVNEKRKAFQTPIGEIELEYLASQNPQLLIVPTVFVWRRKRRTEELENKNFTSKIWKNFVSPITSPWNLFLGDPYQPTGIRKILIMLRQYSRSSLRLSEPFFITEQPAKHLRRRIIISIQQEKRVVLGPQYRSARLVSESILRSPSFNDFAKRIAAEEGTTDLAILKRAQRNFNELAASFSYFTIEMCSWFLHWVFQTIFTDVTFKDEEFDKLRAASKDGALLFIPCHKSYVDFLILSYLLFRKDLLPPHIAAGINMNFWPVGSIFKGGGAFFIRRSFRGNLVYQEVLKRYMAELLQNKLNMEFFIEGQRSRSGKLAPPKYGMLKMIVESYLDGLITEKVSIVPVSLCYDRVTEEGAHKRELEGGEKVKESAVNLLKSVKVLLKNFGRVHARFAEPMTLEGLVKQFIGEGGKSADTRKLGVSKIAFEVCYQINGATPITSFGIVCALLLSRPGGAMARADLEGLLLRMQQDIAELKVNQAPDLEVDYLRTCRGAIDRLIADGILSSYETALGTPGIKILPKQRVAALYYKNTLIHAFIVPAIKGLAKGQSERILELRSLMQFEFFFSEKDKFLREIVQIPSSIMCDIYAYMLDDTLETIIIGLQGLIKMQSFSLDAKDWKNKLMKFGFACIQESTVSRIEGVNTTGFAAFVEMAQNRGWLKASQQQKDTLTPSAARDLLPVLEKVKQYRTQPDEWEKTKDRYLNKSIPSAT